MKAAMSARGVSRQVVADLTGKGPRTVTNWTSGTTLPDPPEREILRRFFVGYDHEGDPVEAAINHSELDEWRKDAVRSFYKRNLHEQRAEASA